MIKALQDIAASVAAGQTYNILGSSITINFGAAETDGACTLITYSAPPGYDGPPLHRHAFAEVYYVLAGSPRFQVGGAIRHAGPGEVVYVAGNVPHTFGNPGDEPATFLIVLAPGGFERYFAELALALAESGGMIAPDRRAALSSKYGVMPV